MRWPEPSSTSAGSPTPMPSGASTATRTSAASTPKSCTATDASDDPPGATVTRPGSAAATTADSPSRHDGGASATAVPHVVSRSVDIASSTTPPSCATWRGSEVPSQAAPSTVTPLM
ncbi:Uncharacterised protein [Mycobacteroides abscessus]|nr:Uncharacterised protein [Mycobacteroides abscessus]